MSPYMAYLLQGKCHDTQHFATYNYAINVFSTKRIPPEKMRNFTPFSLSLGKVCLISQVLNVSKASKVCFGTVEVYRFALKPVLNHLLS